MYWAHYKVNAIALTTILLQHVIIHLYKQGKNTTEAILSRQILIGWVCGVATAEYRCSYQYSPFQTYLWPAFVRQQSALFQAQLGLWGSHQVDQEVSRRRLDLFESGKALFPAPPCVLWADHPTQTIFMIRILSKAHNSKHPCSHQLDCEMLRSRTQERKLCSYLGHYRL